MHFKILPGAQQLTHEFLPFPSSPAAAAWVDLKTINLAAICTPADYNTRPLDTIYSNFIDALPVVRLRSSSSSFFPSHFLLPLKERMSQ